MSFAFRDDSPLLHQLRESALLRGAREPQRKANVLWGGGTAAIKVL